MRRYADIKTRLLKRGYYPKGMGKVELTIEPLGDPKDIPLRLDDLDFKIDIIGGKVHSSEELRLKNVSDRIAEGARHQLKGYDTKIDVEYCNTQSPGCGITLWAICKKQTEDYYNPLILGADKLGHKKIKSEDLGRDAVKKLLNSKKYPCDINLGDHLLPFMVFNDESKVLVPKITDHILTNIYVIEKFFDVKYLIDKNIISIKNL
jgi:RNA 3'-terminal phosphate cyclase